MYIPMPENTPCIASNREAIHLLHFHAHSFLHAPSYAFVLYPCYTFGNSCYNSSTPTLVMTVPPLHRRPFHASHTSHLRPASSLWHASISMQCIPVGIEIHHYCNPSPVRLAIHMHRCSNEHCVYRQLTKRKTLTDEQD